MKRKLYILLSLLCQIHLAAWASGNLYAGTGASVAGARMLSATPKTEGHGRRYDVAHPLIYVDSWAKWPYAFLSEDGVPKGFNVDLVAEMMRRLRIPYQVRLCNQESAHEELRNDSADLSFGAAADYNAPFGRFGRVTVCHYTYGMLVPRADSTGTICVSQLRGRKNIIVSNSSRPHHYLRKVGFPDSVLTVVTDMETEILREATEGTGGALWNSMMLKWVINKYRLGDRFVVVPVDIPYGEYRFMSGDTVLLARLDSLCAVMQQEGEIDRLMTKWMYPEKQPENNTYLTIVAILLCCAIVAFAAYRLIRYYRRYYSRNSLGDVRLQMEQILHANKMKVWVYFPQTRRYAWMTSDGLVKEDFSSFEFSRFYYEDDFNVIHSHVTDFLAKDKKPVMETVRCYSLTEPKKLIRVEVSIRGLRDEYGKIYLVCGVQHDITDSKARLDRMKLLQERYRTALRISQGTLMRFDGSGRLTKLNEIACLRLGIDNMEEFIAEGYTLHDIDLLDGIDIETCPNVLRFTAMLENSPMSALGFTRSKYFRPQRYAMAGHYNDDGNAGDWHPTHNEGYYYVLFQKNTDSDGNVISYMLSVYDRTAEVQMMRRQKFLRRQMEVQSREKAELHTLRSLTLSVTDIWMLTYCPGKKELVIYSRDGQPLSRLSQLNLIELADSGEIKKMFKVFRKLDSLHRGEVTVDVKTRLRNSSGERRHFSFHLHPTYGDGGKVLDYFGTCRDVTAQLSALFNLEKATDKVREADILQYEFLKNTSFSMRQPLISISQHIQNLYKGNDSKGEELIVRSISSDIMRLIMLSDDTMLLSRIEAGLFTAKNEPVDFVQLFGDTVSKVLSRYRTASVTYNVQDTYGKLVVNGDATVLSRILHEAVALSARYTKVGTLSVRYMYRKGMLTLLVEDTGQGIPPSIFQRIYEAHIGDAYTMTESMQYVSGLEMPICKALVEVMGGVIEIESDPGRGTNIYIQLPVEQMENEGTADEETPKRKNIV